MGKTNLSNLRKDYGIMKLDIESVDGDPTQQFESWFKEAYSKEGEEANTMTLSTIGEDGCPEGRVVLLKFYSGDGFTFYTNYNSAKGQQLEANPSASLTIHWKSMERQVRIKGKTEKVDGVISDEYFDTRPRESRISAVASPQSQKIIGREALEEKVQQLKNEYKGKNIPRPENWGGYLLVPYEIEFWQGRPNRLHDRIVYKLVGENWELKRLAP